MKKKVSFSEKLNIHIIPNNDTLIQFKNDIWWDPFVINPKLCVINTPPLSPLFINNNPQDDCVFQIHNCIQEHNTKKKENIIILVKKPSFRIGI
jgi:hypothetical protein